MFEIFDKPEKPVEKKVYLKLIPATIIGQEASLIVVDEKGEVVSGGILLDFYSDGTFGRRANVYSDYGLKLDDNGKIVERK